MCLNMGGGGHSDVDKMRLVAQGLDVGHHFSARTFLHVALQISECSYYCPLMCVVGNKIILFSPASSNCNACIVHDGGGF